MAIVVTTMTAEFSHWQPAVLHSCPTSDGGWLSVRAHVFRVFCVFCFFCFICLFFCRCCMLSRVRG